MNEPYTYNNPVSQMTNNELRIMRENSSHPADRVAAAAELRRREQAQEYHDKQTQAVAIEMFRREQAAPTPGVAGVQGEYDALTAARRIAVNVAAERDQLAAEVERLRGLLAELIDELIISELTEEDAARIEPIIGKVQAAIKAAKEASK